MKQRTNAYVTDKKTGLICYKSDDMLFFDISGKEPITLDLIQILTNTTEDFGLDHRASITNYQNEETIGALFGMWYDKKKRYAQIGRTKTQHNMQGTFRIDNTGKKLLYNYRNSIPLYDYGKIRHYCGLVTTHTPEEIIEQIVNNGYKVYTEYSIRDPMLQINQHPKGALLVQNLEYRFQQKTGINGREMAIVGEEISMQDILKGKINTLEPINKNGTIDSIINRIEEKR